MSFIKLISQYPVASSIGPTDMLLGNVIINNQPPATSKISITTLTKYISSNLPLVDGGFNATQLQSRSISLSAPADNQTLVWIATASQWEPRHITVNSTTLAVTADTTVGSITAGEIISAGLTLQELLNQLLVKTYYPIYNEPAATLSAAATVLESGTDGPLFDINFDRGSIVGKTEERVWQPSAFQSYRSGEATDYILSGVSVPGSTFSPSTIQNFIVQDGANLITSEVNYGVGTQPKDSKQNDFETPLGAGTSTASLTITGGRRAFYGINNLGTSSSSIRTLSSTSPSVMKGSTFTIPVSTNSTNVIFAYPESLGDVASVKYVEGSNIEVKDKFVKTTVVVEGANNYQSINYSVYIYTPVGYGGSGIPFSSPVTYTVTI